MDVPAAKRGNVAGDAEAHRMTRLDDPSVANAIASPCGQPSPGPAADGSWTPRYTSTRVAAPGLPTVAVSEDASPAFTLGGPTANWSVGALFDTATAWLTVAVWPFMVTVAVSVRLPLPA